MIRVTNYRHTYTYRTHTYAFNNNIRIHLAMNINTSINKIERNWFAVQLEQKSVPRTLKDSRHGKAHS